MSTAILATAGVASSSKGAVSFHHRDSSFSQPSCAGSWVDDDEPIPWSPGDVDKTADTGGSIWRANGRHHGSACSSSTEIQPPHASALTSLSLAAARSRVSMDALPSSDPYDHRHSLASSTSSFPATVEDDYEDDTPTPVASKRSTRIVPTPLSLSSSRPVGLGISATVGRRVEEWPPSAKLNQQDAVDESEDDHHEQQEIHHYQSTYRAPVDATLRSVPGVVGLGDGWANVPDAKGKRRWFKRKQRTPEAPVDVDPLMLWSPPQTAAPGATPSASQNVAADPAKQSRWRSRRNLFSASTRNLSATPTSPMHAASTAGHGAPVTGEKMGLLGRSKLAFGSMVDLAKSKGTQQTSSTKPSWRQRHSVAVFSQTSPGGHPGDNSVGHSHSASTSQPSLAYVPGHHHPMLRQAYTRSDSNLGSWSADPFRPSPPIHTIGGAAENDPTKAAWRPALTSTPLVEVQEEEEPDEDAEGRRPESTERPALKRSATFGEDDAPQQPKHATYQPALDTVAPSPVTATHPHREHREQEPKMSTVTISTFTANETKTTSPPASLLNRLKNVLTKNKPRRHQRGISDKDFMSPVSFHSEVNQPATPMSHASIPPSPASVGRGGTRRRSRLFGRNKSIVTSPSESTFYSPEDVDRVLSPTPTSQRPSVTYSLNEGAASNFRSVRSSMTSDILPHTSSPMSPSSFKTISKRTSWAGTIRSSDRDRLTSPSTTTFMESEDLSAEFKRKTNSLRRFRSQSKSRPQLGAVFPKPPTQVDQPPSLHWAFPGSYSTPVLHKFGGSTLSLALDISAEGDAEFDDLHGSPSDPRDRSLRSSLAKLTAREREREPIPDEFRHHMQPTTASFSSGSGSSAPHEEYAGRKSSVKHRTSIPVNIDNLVCSSTDSLSNSNVGVVDFPLPPSTSSGDISSPDPDHVEQLCTPNDARHYPTMSTEYYSGTSSDDSASSGPRMHKQPSWSTCKTSTIETAATLSPLATPTSVASSDDHGHGLMSKHHTYTLGPFRRGSLGSIQTSDSVGPFDERAVAFHPAPFKRPVMI